MFAQVHSRSLNVLLAFETQLPFDKWEMWRDMRKLPLAEQKQWLLNPDKRKQLVEIASRPYEGPAHVAGAEARPPQWDWIFALTDMKGPHKSMADLARMKNTHPVELMIDMALEHDMKFFMIQPIANENQTEALELMKHPRSAVTFSDSGAHVSQIMDSSLQTHLLSHWVREKQAFTLEEAVKMLTCDNATQFGFHDRGLLRPRDGGAGRRLAAGQGRPRHTDRGADRLGQDLCRLHGGDRRSGAPGHRRRTEGPDPGRLRFAAQGAVQRHQAQSRGAAGGHPQGAAAPWPARRRHPDLGADRRHAGRRAPAHGPSAAA